MLAFQVSTSFLSLFGTSKDFETSSLGFFSSLFAIVLEFWIMEELFGANCRFIDKFCRNQLTCSNHGYLNKFYAIHMPDSFNLENV